MDTRGRYYEYERHSSSGYDMPQMQQVQNGLSQVTCRPMQNVQESDRNIYNEDPEWTKKFFDGDQDSTTQQDMHSKDGECPTLAHPMYSGKSKLGAPKQPPNVTLTAP